MAGATEVTVAVNVNGCPKTDGLGDDVTAVLLLALVELTTTWGDVESSPVLLRKLPSPL